MDGRQITNGATVGGEPDWVYTYDAGGRLREVRWLFSGSAGDLYAKLDYNALGQLVRTAYDVTPLVIGGVAYDETDVNRFDNETIEWYAYDEHWRLTAIWRQGPVGTGGAEAPDRPAKKLYQRYLYHQQGLGGFGNDADATQDMVVLRERDTDNDGELDETIWYLQNHRGDVVALAGQTEVGTTVLERVVYTPYGDPTVFAAADVNLDGLVDANDWDYFYSLYVQAHPLSDFNGDGAISDYLTESLGDDQNIFELSYFATLGFDGHGALSRDDLDNRIGYGGYVWDPRLRLYHVRHRVYDPRDGRWLQRDPIGLAGGPNLYEYCGGDPYGRIDPSGLDWLDFITYWGTGAVDAATLGITAGARGVIGYGGQDTAASDAAHGVYRFVAGEGSPSLTRGVNEAAVQALDLSSSNDGTADEALRQRFHDIRNLQSAGPTIAGLAATVVLFEIMPGLRIESGFAEGMNLAQGASFRQRGGQAWIVTAEGKRVNLTPKQAEELLTTAERAGKLAGGNTARVVTPGDFERLAQQAIRLEGPGSGSAYGTRVHARLKELVKGLNNPNVRTEVSYKDSDLVKYGTDGSVRLDIVVYDERGRISAIYDLKTGSATLTPQRIQEIQSHLPPGMNVPIREIRGDQ